MQSWSFRSAFYVAWVVVRFVDGLGNSVSVVVWRVVVFFTVGENHGWFSKDVGNTPKNIEYPKVNDHMAGWNITLVFNRDALPETISPLKIGLNAPKENDINDPIPTIHFQVGTASLPDGTSDQSGWNFPLSFVTSLGLIQVEG